MIYIGHILIAQKAVVQGAEAQEDQARQHAKTQGKMVGTCIATARESRALQSVIHWMTIYTYTRSIACYLSHGRGAGSLAFQRSALRAASKVESMDPGAWDAHPIPHRLLLL